MITIPTVLVLGAGASYPYGFPTAKELKNRICEAFSSPNTAGSRLVGNNLGHTLDQFLKFREAFWRSGVPSVDAFLARRTEFLPVGKLAIAYCLVPLEDESTLFAPPLHGSGDWYEYLSVKLAASFDEFGDNKLSIITFNYDRSLEHYLFTSLRNWHGRSVDECIEKLAEIPIIHVYGQLSRIPYPQHGCRQYLPPGGDASKVHPALLDAAAGITLVHEKESELQEAHNLLTAAERICFLGFSYDPLNLSRLAINTKNTSPGRIFGTARGLIGGELHDAKTRIHKAIGSSPTLDGEDNLQTLRHYQILG